MKKNLALFMMLLAAVAMTGCSSDEKEPQIVICFIQPEIIGKWQLVEVKDGPHEFHQNGRMDMRMPLRVLSLISVQRERLQ